MMRTAILRSAAGTAVALALLGATGCWEVVGVEDRRAGDDAQEDELGPPNACPQVSVDTARPACAACLQESCCAELLACSESAACRACVFPGDDACTAPPEHLDLKACVRGPCAEPCVEPELAGLGDPFCNVVSPTLAAGECASIGDYYGRFECNPVSNEPCVDGEACALDEGQIIWTCRASGHALPACAACGFAEGECAPGHVCGNGVCYRYCCTDEDCGAPESRATCRKPLPGVDAGVCVAPPD
jgi:hypothetical protein